MGAHTPHAIHSIISFIDQQIGRGKCGRWGRNLAGRRRKRVEGEGKKIRKPKWEEGIECKKRRNTIEPKAKKERKRGVRERKYGSYYNCISYYLYSIKSYKLTNR